MQGGSSGIGYGLKYQVTHKTRTLFFNFCFYKSWFIDSQVLSSHAGQMHIRCQSRHRSLQLPHWNSQPQRRERGFISFLFLEINLNLCSKFRWLDLMNPKSIRCICFGFHPVEPSSFARVCSRILTRYGTSVRVRSINGFSLLFFPLVTV